MSATTIARWNEYVRVALLAACAACATCASAIEIAEPGCTQLGFNVEIRNSQIDVVDVLVEVDNSNSMRENQARIVAQLGPMIELLTHPPDDNMDGRPDYPPVRDLHVAVISSDLGTAGARVAGCDDSDVGDDGRMNPIRYGPATRRHPPSTSAPPGLRPADCGDAGPYPSFLGFRSDESNAATFTRDVVCDAALYVGGCGFEQQLEAVHRALVGHRADDRPGNTDPNAGFLREDAVLAIVVITDEDDGSVRDCRNAEPGVPCVDGTSVFRAAAAAPPGDDNATFSIASSSGPDDPRWPLDRYIDPRDPTRGFLSVKPGHPEFIVFAAITGVPTALPWVNQRIDWDALLGAPGPGGPDDFEGRVRATALTAATPEGPVSMRGEPDPSCPGRAVPACRRAGTAYDPAAPPCAPTEQYFAHPARRIVEVARRFDQASLCPGGSCENGVVVSVCGENYSAALWAVVQKIQSRLIGRCMPRSPQTFTDDAGLRTANCDVREVQPPGVACNPLRGRTPLLDAAGRAVVERDARGEHAVCLVAQVPADPSTSAPVTSAASPAGWYFDANFRADDPSCPRRISYTPRAEPGPNSSTRLECITSTVGACSR